MDVKYDALGKELNVGDFVIYTDTRSKIYAGKIISHSKVMTYVGYNKMYPRNTMKITETEYNLFNKLRKS